MAASGIAALLMEGGATFHSRCKPPRDMTTRQPCDITPNNDRGCIFLATRLILIDEISMLHRGNLEALDQALRDLMAYKVHRDLAQVPFGGKVVACTGDVRQILLVVRDDNQNATVRASLLSSPLW